MRHLERAAIKVFSEIRQALDLQSKRLRRRVRDAAATVPKDALVLDVGAGEGRYRDLFTEARYIGIDRAIGDKDWDYRRLDIVADIHRIPLVSGCADAVLCTQVLEHVQSPRRLLEEIHRVLNPGGRVFFSCPQGHGEHQAPHDYFRFTQFAIAMLCRQAGLRVLEIQKTCHFFGYLTNRLSVIPKVLFWPIRNPWHRLLPGPLELLSYILFVLLPPLPLEPLDRFDRQKTYTLDYWAVADRPADQDLSGDPGRG